MTIKIEPLIVAGVAIVNILLFMFLVIPPWAFLTILLGCFLYTQFWFKPRNT